MKLELKPCPFCGATDTEENATQSSALVLRSFRSAVGTDAWRVECKCGASGPAEKEYSDAANGWNRRDDTLAKIAAAQAVSGEK